MSVVSVVVLYVGLVVIVVGCVVAWLGLGLTKTCPTCHTASLKYWGVDIHGFIPERAACTNCGARFDCDTSGRLLGPPGSKERLKAEERERNRKLFGEDVVL